MAFYRAADGVTVNLYAPAEAKVKLDGGAALAIRQETDYPNSGRVEIGVEPEQPATFTLLLRIPAWAERASVAVNGQPVAGEARPGSFFELRREWKPGDRVMLDMPMSWRLVQGRQRQAGRVAVLRGPVVFCLNPVQNPALAELDGVELGYLALKPESLGAPVPSTAVRPEGLGCRVEAWKPGFGLAEKADYELTLTEFPDPDGKATYFRLRDFSVAVEDELLGGGCCGQPPP
jgi:hypothetical protein